MRFSRAFLGVCAGCALAASVPAQTIQINRDNKTIAISTTDEATAIADIAAISVGFEVYGPDSESTYSNAGKLSHGIMEAVHLIGVKDENIESTSQGLQRNNNFDEKATPEERAKKRFVFQESWEVSVPPEVAAKVIHAAIEAGANQTGAIDWRLSDHKVLQAKAAEAALVKARAVANRMADGLHVKLGDLIYASNETPNTKLYFVRKGNSYVLNTEMASVSSRPVGPPLEIRPQTIREEATVYAVFAIE